MTATCIVGAPVSHRDGSQMRRMVDSRPESKVLLPDSGGRCERDGGLRSTLMMLVLAYWWAIHETNESDGIGVDSKGDRSTEGSVKDYSSDPGSTGKAKHFTLSWPTLANQGTSATRAELQAQNRILLEEVQTLRRRCQVLEQQCTEACEGVRTRARRGRRRWRSGRSWTPSESSSDDGDSGGDSDSDDNSETDDTNDTNDTSDSDPDSHADSDDHGFSDEEDDDDEDDDDEDGVGTGSWAFEASLVERFVVSGNGGRDLDVSTTSGDGCDYSSGDESSPECSFASMFSTEGTGCSKGRLGVRAPFSLATRRSAGTMSDSSVQVGDGRVLTEVELAEEYNLAELLERLQMSRQELLVEQFQREVVAQEHAQLRKVMGRKIEELEESLRNKNERAAGAEQTSVDMLEARLQLEALERSDIETKSEIDELRRKNQELVVALRDMCDVLAECQARSPDVRAVDRGNIVHPALEAFTGERGHE